MDPPKWTRRRAYQRHLHHLLLAHVVAVVAVEFLPRSSSSASCCFFVGYIYSSSVSMGWNRRELALSIGKHRQKVIREHEGEGSRCERTRQLKAKKIPKTKNQTIGARK